MSFLSPWIRHPSIRARMTGTFALSIAVLLIISGIVLTRQSRRAAERRATELLDVAAENGREECGESENKDRSLVQIAQSQKGELTIGGLGLLALDGKQNLLWRSDKRLPAWPFTPEEKENWRFIPLDYKGQTLIFVLDFDKVDKELEEREALLVGLGVLIWGTSTLGAWLLVGHTLSPIDQLSNQAQNASTDRLKVRLLPPSRDTEIVGLVETLNGLLQRLERDSEVRGRFYAAASHELRTPLQTLLGEVDVILSRPRENADYREALEVVRGQSLRLTSLVQELLQLNQLEMSTQSPPTASFNLADVVDRSLLPLQSQIEAKNLKIERHLPDMEIEAPPAHCEMLVRNLLENAVKYATSLGEVSLKLIELENGARLEIFNSANVQEGDDLNTWFEPFYRADVARTTGSGGNGLGLAICRAIVDSNEWKIELMARKGGVCAVCVFKASSGEPARLEPQGAMPLLSQSNSSYANAEV